MLINMVKIRFKKRFRLFRPTLMQRILIYGRQVLNFKTNLCIDNFEDKAKKIILAVLARTSQEKLLIEAVKTTRAHVVYI